MSILETVSVPYAKTDSFSKAIREICDRVRAKAFEYHVERRGEEGHDQEDWLRAERAVIISPAVKAHRFDEDVVIEIRAEKIHPVDINLQIAPHGLLFTAPDGEGRRIFRFVHFRESIDWNHIDAEYRDECLRITARIAGKCDDVNDQN